MTGKRSEDLGQRIFRCPDLSIWGTPEGFAEGTGIPASDPGIVALSELLHGVWLAADGKECVIILQSMFSLLGIVFHQMADGHPAAQARLAHQFASRLVSATDEIVEKMHDGRLYERIARQRATARPKQ